MKSGMETRLAEIASSTDHVFNPTIEPATYKASSSLNARHRDHRDHQSPLIVDVGRHNVRYLEWTVLMK